MKLIRYEDPSGRIHHAVERSDAGPLRVEGDPLQGFELTGETAVVGKVLAPVIPTMIWCIGKNYRRHADEVGMGIDEYPEVFAKGANTVQDPGQPIRFPERAKSSEIDYEGELVVVIGKACKDVTREQALDYVAGYTCGNDVSARDWQLKTPGSQWCRGKSSTLLPRSGRAW